ncbi:MAG: indole-3-glycerol phosphate synthase TrpC [Candidatus Sumerlaeia bacterium]
MEKVTQDQIDYGPILRRIVESKRDEVAALKAETSLEEMRGRALDQPAARDFRLALDLPGHVRLIAEVKKASPSKGLIREDFDPVQIAKAYENAGAAAVSVLTDAPFFQGSLEIFKTVRAAIGLPMLRKEFMIDPIQFYEARAHGADAVLLITSILTTDQLQEFFGLAEELGMTALVETHSRSDVIRAMTEIRPRLLGVNNRNLHDKNFHTELEHTSRMMPLIRDLAAQQNQATPLVVSESGIYTATDVAHLRDRGVSAILVGESLMRKDDVEGAVKALLSRA